jgi:predicted permease
MWNGLRIVAPLIMIVLLGTALKRGGFLGDNDRERMTSLLYWVVLPCLLFRSMYLSGDALPEGWNLFLATYLPFFLVPAIALAVSWARRGDRKRLALCAMSAVRANNVYLGLPAAFLAMGESGQAAASIYIAVMLPGYNLLTTMWGEAVLSGGLSPSAAIRTIRRLAKNPLVSSCLLGLLFSLLEIPVHDTLLISMKMVGDMAVGLALFSLGLGISFSNIGLALRRTWPDVLIKLFVHPAVSLLCFVVWPAQDELARVAVLLCAMPTAINTFILAEGMGMEGNYVSDIIAVSTAAAAISIPIWLAILGVIPFI